MRTVNVERIPENTELSERLDLLVRLVQITDQIHPKETATVVMPLIHGLTRTLIQALWLDYVEAGMPYEHDDVGLWRWAKERAGI